MPTAKPKDPQVTVAGEKFALADVEAAIEILENAAGIMVKQPLSRAGNPLAGMDYHAVANAHRASLPEAERKIQMKPAVIAALRDLVAKPTAAKATSSATPTAQPATEKVA
jgi:hypothetical protein